MKKILYYVGIGFAVWMVIQYAGPIGRAVIAIGNAVGGFLLSIDRTF